MSCWARSRMMASSASPRGILFSSPTSSASWWASLTSIGLEEAGGLGSSRPNMPTRKARLRSDAEEEEEEEEEEEDEEEEEEEEEDEGESERTVQRKAQWLRVEETACVAAWLADLTDFLPPPLERF